MFAPTLIISDDNGEQAERGAQVDSFTDADEVDADLDATATAAAAAAGDRNRTDAKINRMVLDW